MSSVAARPSRPRFGGGVWAAQRSWADAWLTLVIAGVLVVVAFAASGGLTLGRSTWTECGLMLLSAGLVAAALLSSRASGPLYGAVALAGLAGLAVFTALSITWSVSPADSWLETSRTLAYAAVLAGAIALVRLVPGRWDALLSGIALACTVVCAWALLTKVFPGQLSADETYARLRAPFGYWNATGLMAALGVFPLLWLAARRSGHPAANGLAWPGLGLLFTCLMLSYSRGALVALLVGLAFWFAVVPLRLRAALPLFVSACAAAPVVAWAFERDALSAERMPLAARTDAGHDLGALLLLMAVVLLLLGLATNFLADQRTLEPRVRRAAGRALLVCLLCVPLTFVAVIATAPGGLSGQTSKAWNQLTNPQASTPANTPDRLSATSSVRARYWREAWHVFQASELRGLGAGGFVVARTRYRGDRIEVRHAHGYLLQTLADLGLIGLALSLVAAIGWAVAAVRATGLWRRKRLVDAEQVGLLTMTALVVTFGVHSAVDWTWFVPGNAVVALVCAGWVAGRGPGALPATVEPRAAHRPSRVRVAGAAGVVAVALVLGWAALQPVRSAHAEDAANDAVASGDFRAAERDAKRAADLNPLSLDPQWLLAFIADARGDKSSAQRLLERAARRQPANSETWRRLGRYRLSVLNDPRRAIEAFRVAYYLDPDAQRSGSDLLEATRALEAKRG